MVFCCHLVVRRDATAMRQCTRKGLSVFLTTLYSPPSLHRLYSESSTRSGSPYTGLTLSALNVYATSQQLFISESSGDTSNRPTVNLSPGLCSVFLLTGLSDRVIKCLFPRLSDPCVRACVRLRWLSICISPSGTKSHLYHVDRWRLNLRACMSLLPPFSFKAAMHI